MVELRVLYSCHGVVDLWKQYLWLHHKDTHTQVQGTGKHGIDLWFIFQLLAKSGAKPRRSSTDCSDFITWWSHPVFLAYQSGSSQPTPDSNLPRTTAPKEERTGRAVSCRAAQQTWPWAPGPAPDPKATRTPLTFITEESTCVKSPNC